MRQLLLLTLLLPFAAANAQIRYHFGDDPRWADPGFDDSAWNEAGNLDVPAPPFQSRGYLWIRYRVPVSKESSGPLALRLDSPPAVKRLPSETWVNGKPIVSLGGFPPDLALLRRSHTQVFDLPQGLVPPGSIAVVAQRCWIPPVLRDSTAARSVEIAAREPLRLQENLALLQDKYRTIPSKTFYLASAAFGVLILLVYRLMRGGRELLWFGTYLVVSGIYENIELINGPGEVRTLTEGVWNNLADLLATGILLTLFLWTAFRPKRIWPLLLSAFLSVLGWFLATFPVLIAEPYGWLRWPFLNAETMWLISNAILVWIGLSQAFGPARSRTADGRGLGLALAVGMVISTAGNYGLLKSLPFAGFAIADFLMLAAMGILLLHGAWRKFQTQRELESDLDAARQVQTALLNMAHPDAPAFSVEVISEPARQVGGDFHWCAGSSSDGSLIVVVGDVSGKGLKAAMTVSVAMGILSVEKSKSPAAILANLNDGLSGRTPGFVTCCCARFDSSGQVTVANAGHPAPYVDGRELQLEAGLPLGIAGDVEYSEDVTHGERFTFVSDGVVEAANGKGELFGFDRTRDISGKSAQEIAEAAKAWGQNDDITVVTIQRIASRDVRRKNA